MNKDEINEKLLRLAGEMNSRHVTYANARAGGATQKDALEKADYSRNSPNAVRIEQRPDVEEFIRLKKSLATEVAQEELNYTEIDWLRNQVEILGKAMGKELMSMAVKKVDKDGNITYDNIEVSGEDLAQANRAQELLGKRLGILTDVKKLKAGEGVSFSMNFGGQIVWKLITQQAPSLARFTATMNRMLGAFVGLQAVVSQ